MARFLPLGIDLHDVACVVVGGGRIGTRKAKTLLDAGARVTVVAPRISPELTARARAGALHWIAEPYREELLGRATLVVAATDDPSVNQEVVRAARARGALVCDASSAERSQVIFGALHRTADLTVAVFTNGQDPARARRTRDRIARHVDAPPPMVSRSAAAAPAPLILIAHGSRDPRWRASIEDVVRAVQEQVGREAVSLAYMDRAPPTLAHAVAAAVQAGSRHLRVLPLFLATEGHVDRDIRPLVQQAMAAHPGVSIEFLPPIGQLAGFQQLLVSLASEASASARPDPAGTGAGTGPCPEGGTP